MADQRISELNAITGASTADDDLFVIVDTSAGETKKITKAELTSTINNALIDGAPATLDTLNELAAALADDANFATTVTNSLAGKVDTTGDTMTGNLNFGDNNKAIFGAGSDLQIYSNGDSSFISEQSTTGSLNVLATNFYLYDSAFAKYMMTATANGAVDLRYDGSQKLSTTSTGIDVTGTATMDGLTVDTAKDTSGITLNTPYGVAGEQYAAIRWNNSSFAGGDSEIRNVVDGTASVGSSLEFHTEQTGTGTLTERLKLHNNGDISFYEDTGTTAKFFWDASAERLGIGTSSPSRTLTVVPPTRTASLASNGFVISDLTTATMECRQSTTENSWYSNTAMAFATSNTERMRIDSSGNVGIGTSSPSGKLHSHVTTIGDASLRLSRSGSSAFEFQQGISGVTGDALVIKDVSLSYDYLTLRSGNVGIGTSSPTTILGGSSVEVSNGTGSEVIVFRDDGSTVDGDFCGGFVIGNRDASGTPNHYAGMWADTDTYGNMTLQFAGGRDKYEAGTADMVIDSSGNLLVGTTSASSSTRTVIKSTGINSLLYAGNEFNFADNHTTANGDLYFNYQELSGGGSIDNYRFMKGDAAHSYSTLRAAAFTVTSDYRTKENIVPLDNAVDRVKQLKPYRFNFIDGVGMESGRTVDGFIAHEAQEVVPEAVEGVKDAMTTKSEIVTPAQYDEEGNLVAEAIREDVEIPAYQGIDQSKLVPLLTAALQEALTRIETLEAKVAVLENN